MQPTQDFAILAPVPQEHLVSGMPIAQEKGFVAFGSRKWELFRKIDEMRGDKPVPVLIYASHEDDNPALSFRIRWGGWYIGSEESGDGRHSLGMEHRPPTTAKYESDNRGHWAVFWHVRDLFELPQDQQMPISALQTFKGGWRKDAPPRGPELVAAPSAIEFPVCIGDK